MNERIIKLADKAVEDISSCPWNISEEFCIKFARLIVQECINESAYIGQAKEVFGDRTDRGGLNHILWTTETAIEKIKQHFGVEE